MIRRKAVCVAVRFIAINIEFGLSYENLTSNENTEEITLKLATCTCGTYYMH